jgi:signal transduction histidine kinase
MVIAIFCFLMIALAFIEYLGIKKINKIQETLVTETYVKVELVQDMRFLARHKAVLVRNILMMPDQEVREYELQRMREQKQHYLADQVKLASLVERPEENAILDKIITGEKETNLLWEKVIQYGINGDIDQGTKLLASEVRSRQWGWLDSLNEMVDLQKEYARADYAYDIATTSRINVILIVINLLAIGIGLFLSIAISRSITEPLRDFAWKVEKIAQGDLSVQVDYDARDEIGLLGKNINRMVKMRKKNLEELEAYRLHLEELVGHRTEELNRQREEFISVLIHDLKGPLTPILGFTKRLIAGKAKSVEDTLTYLHTIEESSKQLLEIIEKISRDLHEKSTLNLFHPERFDISNLTRTIAERFIPKTEDRKIALQINGLEEGNWQKLEPLLYEGDHSQIKTLIENLVGNAVKYAGSRIQLELWKADNKLHLSVTDDGPGIAKEYQEKIFEQYFQIPGSKQGTGIGLYSVLKVVENHRGNISVDSLPDKGSCFRVVLPFTESG